MQKITITVALVAAGALAAPALAAAHVTVQPEELPAGTFTRMDVRVPNERDDSGTVKVDVQMPDGFYFASFEPVAGWDVEVTKEKLDEPVEIEPGFEATEQVTRVTWTGDGEDGLIPPDAFQDFGLSVLTPDAAGEELTFKALQTYEGGEVVRWIGAPDADEPAPVVTLTEGESAHGTAHEEGGEDAAAEEEPEATEPAADGADEDEGSSDGLAIAGLVLGGLGLAAGGTALSRSRRSA